MHTMLQFWYLISRSISTYFYYVCLFADLYQYVETQFGPMARKVATGIPGRCMHSLSSNLWLLHRIQKTLWFGGSTLCGSLRYRSLKVKLWSSFASRLTTLLWKTTIIQTTAVPYIHLWEPFIWRKVLFRFMQSVEPTSLLLTSYKSALTWTFKCNDAMVWISNSICIITSNNHSFLSDSSSLFLHASITYWHLPWWY